MKEKIYPMVDSKHIIDHSQRTKEHEYLIGKGELKQNIRLNG